MSSNETATATGFKPDRMPSVPDTPAPIGEDGPTELAPVARRSFTIVKREMPSDITPQELVHSFIAGIDDPDSMDEETAMSRPWWAPQTAEDVDKINMAIEILQQGLQERIAFMQLCVKGLASKQSKLLNLNADLIQVAAPVKEGGKFKDWRGPWTLGNYRNQPERAPDIKIVDEQKAIQAGFLVRLIKVPEHVAVKAGIDITGLSVEKKIETSSVRDFTPDKAYLEESGIALLPKAPVSYSPAKLKSLASTAEGGAA